MCLFGAVGFVAGPRRHLPPASNAHRTCHRCLPPCPFCPAWHRQVIEKLSLQSQFKCFFCNSNILEQFVFHSSPSLLWVAAAVNCLEGVQKIIIRFPATVLPWLNKTYSCSLVCLDQSLIATATTPSPTRSSLSASCPPANLGSVFALCEASFLQLPSVFNSPRWSYLFYHLRSPLLPVPSIMPASVKVP